MCHLSLALLDPSRNLGVQRVAFSQTFAFLDRVGQFVVGSLREECYKETEKQRKLISFKIRM